MMTYQTHRKICPAVILTVLEYLNTVEKVTCNMNPHTLSLILVTVAFWCGKRIFGVG